ncbi:hypothetical protein [Neolewinella sp.]|uniref:hypothetical protein n=1 Tax=Neolewinella sp. TaxID=2993543 RepID=UPI003B52518F
MTTPHYTYPSMVDARERAAELGYAMEPVSVYLHEKFRWRFMSYHLIYLLYIPGAWLLHSVWPPVLYILLGVILLSVISGWVTGQLENDRFGGALLKVRICEDGDWEFVLEMGGRTWLADATVGIHVTRAYEEMDFGERVGRTETLFSREAHLLDRLVEQPDDHALVARLPGPTTALPPAGYYREGKVEWKVTFTHPQRWWTDLHRRATVTVTLAEPPLPAATERKGFRLPSWVPIFGSK